jgi:hypothetical protein
MTILGLLVVLVLAGVALHAFNAIAPGQTPTPSQNTRTIVTVVVCVLVLAWLFEAFGVYGPYPLRFR